MTKKDEAATLNAQIRDVLKEEFWEPVPTNKQVTLKDENSGMEVVVWGVPDPFTTIFMSKVDHLSALKDGTLKRICDHLLVAKIGETHHAIFVELKRTLSGNERPKDQLRRSYPVLEYLLAVCIVESGETIPRPSMNYVLIGEKSGQLDKQSVKPPSSQKIGEETYQGITIKKFLGPRVAFADLVSDS